MNCLCGWQQSFGSVLALDAGLFSPLLWRIFTQLWTTGHGPVLNESFSHSEGFIRFVIPMHGVWMSNGKSTDSRMKHGLSHPVAVVGSTEHRIKGFRVKRIKHRSWWLRRWWMGLILSKSSPDKGDHYCPASTYVFVFNLLTAEMTYKSLVVV